MAGQRDPYPFTWTLTYILLGITVVYLVFNFAFISYCSSSFYRSTESGVCAFAHSFESMSGAIPTITRPVGVLRHYGKDKRANVIKYDYLFSWGSAVITCAVMALISLFMALRSDANDVQQMKMLIEQVQRQYGRNADTKGKPVIALFLMASLYGFFDAYWGDFDFSGQQSLANLVQVRNSDLYRISFDLFLLLAFSVFFIVWGAKIIAIRKQKGRQRLNADLRHKL